MIQKVFVKMKFIILFCVLFSIYKCSQQQAASSNMEYKNNHLKKIIGSFIDLITERTSNKIITVELKNTSDTIKVSMADTYPDLRYTKFIGSDTLKGYKIYFVGETNKNIYDTLYSEKVPQEVAEINKKLFDKNFPPPAFDPRLWIFYFKDSLLIGFTPKEEIDKYLK